MVWWVRDSFSLAAPFSYGYIAFISILVTNARLMNDITLGSPNRDKECMKYQGYVVSLRPSEFALNRR